MKKPSELAWKSSLVTKKKDSHRARPTPERMASYVMNDDSNM